MQTVLHLFTIFISLSTATGIFIHDGRIDRVVGSGGGQVQTVQSKRPAAKNTNGQSGDLGLHTDPHTHPQHASAGLKSFAHKNSPNPSYPPRELKMKKYLQQNYEPRGRHAFDNHYLPIVG